MIVTRRGSEGGSEAAKKDEGSVEVEKRSDLGLSVTAATEEKIENSERCSVASDEKEETTVAESASVVDDPAECDVDQEVGAGHEANECAGVSESDDSVNADILAYVEDQTEERAVQESEESRVVVRLEALDPVWVVDEPSSWGEPVDVGETLFSMWSEEPKSVAAAEVGEEVDLNIITEDKLNKEAK
ncbi:unnamed protein product [Phytophthora fragariaefolia]|uniref:Unnamed protein product n=1 Tax=Phytophthora fragariaefolia TaxID=1490495 RepID=A0A9W6XHZ4_9STRA|nr:unnamed protein product [Phytophthora fragariaefolia]